MPANFYARLREYYLNVAKVLRGDAEVASVFPNPTDIGVARERIYAEFLRMHAPSKCNVFLGGFLFDIVGNESKQLDVIVTTDTAPRFDFHNQDGGGKAFSPVEGTLGVASIKSNLDKTQLYDALDGIASIPPTQPLEGRIPFTVRIENYDDWPFKVVYSTNGLSFETILGHLAEYYRQNSHIPFTRRPHVIHVAGKYAIFRVVPGMGIIERSTRIDKGSAVGTFEAVTTDSDIQGMVWVLNGLQQNASASAQILYNYVEVINRINGLG